MSMVYELCIIDILCDRKCNVIVYNHIQHCNSVYDCDSDNMQYRKFNTFQKEDKLN